MATVMAFTPVEAAVGGLVLGTGSLCVCACRERAARRRHTRPL